MYLSSERAARVRPLLSPQAKRAATWSCLAGTHVRSDFQQTSDAWLKKQVVRVVDGMPHFADAPL
jgi:hypothetical protein